MEKIPILWKILWFPIFVVVSLILTVIALADSFFFAFILPVLICFVCWYSGQRYHLTSPDGTCFLRSRNVSGIFLLMTCLEIAILLKFIFPDAAMDPDNAIGKLTVSLVLFCLLGILIYFPLALVIIPIWSFHVVRIRRNGHTMNWHVKFCVWHTSQTEYFWMPDGKSLLIAQSDEHCWYLFQYDLNGERMEASFPFCIVLGHTPPMRKVSFCEDWPWLEKLWQEYGVNPEEKVNREVITRKIEGDTATQCKLFFGKILDKLNGFPRSELSLAQFWERQGNRKYAFAAYRRMLDCIPVGSTTFEHLKSVMEEKIKYLGGASF